MAADWAAFRALFPTLKAKTYLASGSYGLLARPVEAAFRRYLDDRLEKGVDWGGWGERQEAVRGAVASLLNAQADEIAVTTSASDGINSLASAIDFTGPRNKVLLSNLEFPTGAQIWHAQGLARAPESSTCPRRQDGSIPLEHFAAAIDETTKLIQITHVCYRNGQRPDVAAVIRLAHERGAMVLLDAFQSAGALAIDVQALEVDFAVGGMLKYLLGTAGIGWLYVARRHLGLTPTASGWFAQADIDAMDIFANDPAPDARRFHTGTPPVINSYAAEAGIDLIRDIGIGAIEARIREVTGEAMDRLADAGCKLATPREDHRRGPQVAIRSTDAALLTQRLAERGVVASWRDGNVRAMFHAYNNAADVAALIEGLLASRDLLL